MNMALLICLFNFMRAERQSESFSAVCMYVVLYLLSWFHIVVHSMFAIFTQIFALKTCRVLFSCWMRNEKSYAGFVSYSDVHFNSFLLPKIANMEEKARNDRKKKQNKSETKIVLNLNSPCNWCTHVIHFTFKWCSSM